MEKTRVNTWHLHIDGTKASEQFAEWCVGAGFVSANFCGHPDGFEHFEPKLHLTLKMVEREAFDRTFEAVCKEAAHAGFIGYVEGEYIARVIEVANQPFVDMTSPFVVERRRLEEKEEFREGELHLTFDADASDQRRISQLLEMGLYGAYEHKWFEGVLRRDKRFLVLTMQGYMRDVNLMAKELASFLSCSGGLIDARLKIERAVAWELFGITTPELPPIAGRVVWR